MDRTFIQSSEIKKVCGKHGKIDRRLVFLRNTNRDSHSAYCPYCVEEILLNHLEPLWEVFTHGSSPTLSFNKDK